MRLTSSKGANLGCQGRPVSWTSQKSLTNPANRLAYQCGSLTCFAQVPPTPPIPMSTKTASLGGYRILLRFGLGGWGGRRAEENCDNPQEPSPRTASKNEASTNSISLSQTIQSSDLEVWRRVIWKPGTCVPEWKQCVPKCVPECEKTPKKRCPKKRPKRCPKKRPKMCLFMIAKTPF